MRQIWNGRSEDERQEMRQKIKAGLDSLSQEEYEKWKNNNRKPRSEETKKKLKDNWHKNHPESSYPRGRVVTEEQRQKIREAAIRQNAPARAERDKRRAEWEVGRAERELERRKKISNALTGIKRSDETKEKVRQAVISKWNDPEYRERHQLATQEAMKNPEVLKRLSESHKGKRHSPEQRAKIGKATRGLKRSEETRRRMSESLKRAWKRRKEK